MKLVLHSFSFIILFLSSSQMTAKNPENWATYLENDKIRIEYRYINCNFSSTAKQEIVSFKYTNLSDKNLTLSYFEKIWNNDICINCEKDTEEFQKTIKIAIDEEIITDCSNQWNELVIFSGFITNDEEKTRYSSLTKFELTKLIISDE